MLPEIRVEFEESLIPQIFSNSEKIVLVISKQKYDEHFYGNFGCLQTFLAPIASKYCLSITAQDIYQNDLGARVVFERDYDSPNYEKKLKRLRDGIIQTRPELLGRNGQGMDQHNKGIQETNN